MIATNGLGSHHRIDMKTSIKFGIIEDIKSVRRIRLGRFWGVTILITPYLWLGPIVFFALHFILNLLNFTLSLEERFSGAFFFTIAVEATTLIHALGHILSGKLVGSAMDELLIASTRDVNIYHGDQSQFPSRVHLGRALGGPILNLLVAALCLYIAPNLPIGFWSKVNASMIVTNLFFGFGSFLPLRSVDGEVIWRELLKRK